MTAVTFPLRPPRLAFAICGRRWQNDVHEIKYSVCVTSYLTNRTQAVCVEDELSSPTPVLSGVPQGSVLDPVLFTLYINDLPSCIQFSNITMYADDTVIYLSSTSTSDIELKLNLDLANSS